MILGRSTVQWTALFTALGGLAQLLIVQFLEVDPTTVATIIGAVVAFLGTFIAFLANTETTPVRDPILPTGTIVRVKDTADTVTIAPTPPGPSGNDGGATGPVSG